MKSGDRVSIPDGADGEVILVHPAGEYWEDDAAVVELADGSRLTYKVDQLSSDSSKSPSPRGPKLET